MHSILFFLEVDFCRLHKDKHLIPLVVKICFIHLTVQHKTKSWLYRTINSDNGLFIICSRDVSDVEGSPKSCDEDVQSCSKRDLTRYGRDYYVASGPKRTPSWHSKYDKPDLVLAIKKKDSSGPTIDHCVSLEKVSTTSCMHVSTNIVACNGTLGSSSTSAYDTNTILYPDITSINDKSNVQYLASSMNDISFSERISNSKSATNLFYSNKEDLTSSTNAIGSLRNIGPTKGVNKNDTLLINKLERSFTHNNQLRSSQKSKGTKQFCLNPLFESSSNHENLEAIQIKSVEMNTVDDNTNQLESPSSCTNMKIEKGLSVIEKSKSFLSLHSSCAPTKNIEVSSDYYSSYESLPYLSNFKRDGSLRLPKPAVIETIFEPLLQRSQSMRVGNRTTTQKADRPNIFQDALF